jgi:hypothetical protein
MDVPVHFPLRRLMPTDAQGSPSAQVSFANEYSEPGVASLTYIRPEQPV